MIRKLKSILQKPTIYGCTILFGLWALINIIFSIGEKGNTGHVILGIMFSLLAIGIYRQNQWVLRLTAAIFLLIAIILPIGILNPFTAGDYMVSGKEPPSVMLTLLWLIPIDTILLGIVIIIDPIKLKKSKAREKI